MDRTPLWSMSCLLQLFLVPYHTVQLYSAVLALRADMRLVCSSQQVFSLAGSTFSLPSSHIFGTPMGTVNPLLTQAESSHTGMLALLLFPF